MSTLCIAVSPQSEDTPLMSREWLASIDCIDVKSPDHGDDIAGEIRFG